MAFQLIWYAADCCLKSHLIAPAVSGQHRKGKSAVSLILASVGYFTYHIAGLEYSRSGPPLRP